MWSPGRRAFWWTGRALARRVLDGERVELARAQFGFGDFPRLTGSRRRLAQAAHKAALRVVRMRHEMTAAAATGRHLQHAGVEETHQRPCAGQAQHGLVSM